jgi:hypothetical protein
LFGSVTWFLTLNEVHNFKQCDGAEILDLKEINEVESYVNEAMRNISNVIK